MGPNTKAVTRSTRFGNSFAVVKPMRGAGRSWRIVWSTFRAGRGRRAPAGFEPIKCETQHQAHEVAVRLFREWITHPYQAKRLDEARRELRGWNLACSCPLDMPCHADVLLELVNEV
jgi:hypothetical protein